MRAIIYGKNSWEYSNITRSHLSRLTGRRIVCKAARAGLNVPPVWEPLELWVGVSPLLRGTRFFTIINPQYPHHFSSKDGATMEGRQKILLLICGGVDAASDESLDVTEFF